MGQRSLNSVLSLQKYQDTPESRYQVSSSFSNVLMFAFAIRAHVVWLEIKGLGLELSLRSMALMALTLDWDSGCNDFNKYYYGWLWF